jgi:hypothetical protein
VRRRSVRRAGGAGLGAGGAGSAGTGSCSTKPWRGTGADAGTGGVTAGGGAVRLGMGGAGVRAGAAAATSTGGLTGGGAAGATGDGGARTMRKGWPSPGRMPGMPNCSSNSKPCRSSDTSKPPASRRFAGASVDGARGAAAGVAVSVCMLMAVVGS